MLGAGATLAPGASTRGYGIASDDPEALAYVRACGARDLVLGALLALALANGERRQLGATLGCCALVGLADFLIVRRAQGSEPRPAVALHAAGCAGCALVALLVVQGI